MRKGIDVSDNNHPHNVHIDWQAVARSGVTWAGVKVTEGATFRSRHAEADFHGASAAGIEVVGYHFARPTMHTPAEEAKNLLGHWHNIGGHGDLALDFEDGRQLGWHRLAEWVKAFGDLVPMRFVYWNRDYQRHLSPFIPTPLERQWVASYGGGTFSTPPAIHQHGQGDVPGIHGLVDLDYVYYDRKKVR